MEWCDRGSLEAAVSDGLYHGGEGGNGNQQANMPMICATLLDIAAGMAYLHKMHILHCDLKLRNVLLKSSQASDHHNFNDRSLVHIACCSRLNAHNAC